MSTYSTSSSLSTVKGIGPALATALANKNLFTIKDLLLFIPLRYEDRSIIKKIAELTIGEMVTIKVEVVKSGNFYKGRRSIQNAIVKDDSGKLKLMWFNNPHVVQSLVAGKEFFVSGKLGDRGVMVQPIIEVVKEETIHTGRLVPIYSMIKDVPPATFRRILKEIVDHLAPLADWQTELKLPVAPSSTSTATTQLSLNQALSQIHFPDQTERVISARERLALEELLGLIQHSQTLKEEWQKLGNAPQITSPAEISAVLAEYQLPFILTGAQQRCVMEILNDVSLSMPMNRLLIGDVGSGKTAVAGIACGQLIRQGFSAALVAPTQILAEQHAATFQKLFPDLPIQILTSKSKMAKKNQTEQSTGNDVVIDPTPKMYIGTHAVLNYLETIQPGLLIYDEQHRFGVKQRSVSQNLARPPHILTLSATPIPRTLMLTLFSHLQLSVIDEMPAGRKPIKTWLVPETKRLDSLTWIQQQIDSAVAETGHQTQALIVCPFIDQSEAEGLDHIAAATQTYEVLTKFYADQKLKSRTTKSPQLRMALLHGRLKKPAQTEITDQLYAQKIDLLVTTPIVEVGVDLPAATIIVIEAAERFGLASLHQLRGRVGRAGQQAYCLLFTSSKSDTTTSRLKKFCEIHNGLELAELDLQRRGAGDLFGTQQHGLDQLQFAEWTNLQLVTLAKQVTDQLQKQHLKFTPFIEVAQSPRDNGEEIPLAN